MAAVAVQEAVSVFLFPDEGRGPGAGGPILDPGLRRGTIKWPNDILIGSAKFAGILLERSGDVVVVGIGVNLAHHPDLPDRPATSLAALGHLVARDVFAEVLADSFARWLSRWRLEGLAPVRAAWLRAAHPVGTALTVRLPDGEQVDGLFGGLDEGGALILRLAGDDRRVIHAADVFLI